MSGKRSTLMNDLYRGLQILSNASFPRRCATCGKVYKNVDAFLSETDDLRDSSGLMNSIDDDDAPIVEMYRNCTCGSTLLEFFGDRRDTSPLGLKRRKAFGNVLDKLTTTYGLTTEQARTELLHLLYGRDSTLLRELGLDLSRRRKKAEM